jgi:TPR repeat protein
MKGWMSAVLAPAVLGAVLGAALGTALGAATTAAQGLQQAAPPHACDELAGNPLDPQRVGPGVEARVINARRAILACEAAVELFPAELRFQFQLGRAYRQAGRYEDALQWYRAAAEAGYAGAQNSLGVMFSRGEGVAQDCDAAAQWMGRAAAQGYPIAITNLRNLRCVQVA